MKITALLPLLLIACATAPAQEPSPSTACNAEVLSNLVGREGDAELGAEAQRRSGARRLRWIRPGDAVTMDYSEERLNIYLDAAGRVERFVCG